MTYIITRSGHAVSPHGGTIDLADIRTGLVAAPRFAGHTRKPWCVLQHSLVVWRLLREAQPLPTPESQLWALLHDAHEAYTGDIPSPFKTPSMAALQQRFDVRIWRELTRRPAPLLDEDRDIVHRMDGRALLAEALVVGPPSIDEMNLAIHFSCAPETMPTPAERAAVAQIAALDITDAQSIWHRGCVALINEVKNA